MKDNNKGGKKKKYTRSAGRLGLGRVKRKREKILLEKQTQTSTVR